MKTISKIIALLALVLAILACNAVVPKPTATPAPTATVAPTQPPEPTNPPIPTENPTEADFTAIPTEITQNLVFPTPGGTPVKDWEGIPIPPGAIAGDTADRSYVFTIQSTPDEIRNFYEKELKKSGWNMFAVSEGSDLATLLMFMKGSDSLTVTIMSQSNDTLYVMLVK